MSTILNVLKIIILDVIILALKILHIFVIITFRDLADESRDIECDTLMDACYCIDRSNLIDMISPYITLEQFQDLLAR